MNADCSSDQTTPSLATPPSKPCHVLRGIFGRWYIVHPDHHDLAWSGSHWARTLRGAPCGDWQICNFESGDNALEYARSNGFVVVGVLDEWPLNDATTLKLSRPELDPKAMKCLVALARYVIRANSAKPNAEQLRMHWDVCGAYAHVAMNFVNLPAIAEKSGVCLCDCAQCHLVRNVDSPGSPDWVKNLVHCGGKLCRGEGSPALTLEEAKGDASKLGTVSDFLNDPKMADVTPKNGGAR